MQGRLLEFLRPLQYVMLLHAALGQQVILYLSRTICRCLQVFVKDPCLSAVSLKP